MNTNIVGNQTECLFSRADATLKQARRILLELVAFSRKIIITIPAVFTFTLLMNNIQPNLKTIPFIAQPYRSFSNGGVT